MTCQAADGGGGRRLRPARTHARPLSRWVAGIPRRALYALVPLLAACGGDGGAPVSADEGTFVIQDATIVDGTGRAAFTGSRCASLEALSPK